MDNAKNYRSELKVVQYFLNSPGLESGKSNFSGLSAAQDAAL